MNYQLPEEYKPISAWGYVGYQILYAIPLIGFIILIVKAVGAPNINVRNHARSYFCIMLLSIIISVIFFVIAMVLGFNISSIVNK